MSSSVPRTPIWEISALALAPLRNPPEYGLHSDANRLVDGADPTRPYGAAGSGKRRSIDLRLYRPYSVHIKGIRWQDNPVHVPAILWHVWPFAEWTTCCSTRSSVNRSCWSARRRADSSMNASLPLIRDCYRDGRFPSELIPEIGALGFLGANLEGYGCAGMSNVEYGLIMQEIERGDSGLRSFVSVAGRAGDVSDPDLRLGRAEAALAAASAIR